MKCPECNLALIEIVGNCQYRDCGLDNVRLTDWPMKACPDGHVRLPIITDDRVLIIGIVEHLVTQHERLTADEILFLRKNLGFKAGALAKMLNVDRVTVSRWENGHSEISTLAEFRLRLFAADQLLPQERRDDIRSEVALVLQHRYDPDSVDGEIQLSYGDLPPHWIMAQENATRERAGTVVTRKG